MLSEEDKKRIEEEEKFRLEVQKAGKVEEKSVRKKKETKAVLIIWSIMAFFILYTALSPKPTPEENAEKEKRNAEFSCSSKADAYSFVERSIKKTLKAPSTVEMSGIWGSTITPLENCKFIIKGHFDAENSFGAKLRTHYRADAEYDMEARRWKLLEFNEIK